MAEHVITMPDIGEGVAEVELVSWRVRKGETVKEDQIIAEVMTDKAAIEIPSPVDGVVVWLGGAAGDKVAVGAPIVRLEIGAASQSASAQQTPTSTPTNAAPPLPTKQTPAAPSALPLAAPALRARAKTLGVDLAALAPGSGPDGRIIDADLDAFVAGKPNTTKAYEDFRLVGLRRKIAEKMTLAVARIPHITYVEEVDVTTLEQERARLNAEVESAAKLSVLPFLMRALVQAIADQPNFNAHYNDESGKLRRFRAVHIGVATQTDDGLLVPVVRDAQDRDLASLAEEIARLAHAARSGKASREELTGSTITVTSLGALGGLVTTPIINHPEVAIIGINKIRIAPVWDDEKFVPRKLMNISASFDHRVIDGYDAAVLVRKIKMALEAEGG